MLKNSNFSLYVPEFQVGESRKGLSGACLCRFTVQRGDDFLTIIFEREGKRGYEIPFSGLFPKCPQHGSQSMPPMRMAGTRPLGASLLPPRVHVSRRLELVDPGMEPMWDTGFSTARPTPALR